MKWITLVQLAVWLGAEAQGPAVDWVQRGSDGAYRFGYATGDEGGHYHLSSASADNTVAGRFGFKDAGTGRDLQTTYTAGRRGFRAQGPHIARHMDLSQDKPPFSRPNNDGQYHPELDNVFDPNEDRGYDYTLRTKDQVKEEHANAVGDVQGRYSYLDDVGGRHHVDYVAGSRTGFVVTNPVPDTFAQAQAAPLFFVGNRPGPKTRGFSAVQKGLDGSYRFAASGPDHKRVETSDAQGNVRGTYTYLDDKGVQHTVDYIAGANIGYKVLNNQKSVQFNPSLSTALPPLSTTFPTFPTFPSTAPLLPSSPSPSPATPSPLPPFPSTTFQQPPVPESPTTALPPFSSTYPPSYPSPTTFSPSWPYYDGFLDPKDWSKHTKISSDTKVNIQKPFPTPDYADFGYLHHQLFPEEGFHVAESGRPRPPYEHGYNQTKFLEGGVTQRPRGHAFRGDVRYGGVRKSSSRGEQDDYFRIPTGVAVRAHVQSLDLVPYDKRYISPGEALDGFTSHSSGRTSD